MMVNIESNTAWIVLNGLYVSTYFPDKVTMTEKPKLDVGPPQHGGHQHHQQQQQQQQQQHDPMAHHQQL